MNKKVLALFLIGSLLFAGCSSVLPSKNDNGDGNVDLFGEALTSELSTESSSEEIDEISMIDEENGELTVEKQVKIYADDFESWSVPLSDLDFDIYLYGLIDLNSDGIYELIVSTCQGSGIYTYSTFYTIDSETKSVVTIEQAYDEMCGPDIAGQKSFIYYTYEDDDMKFISVEDTIRDGAAHNMTTLYQMFIENDYVCLSHINSYELSYDYETEEETESFYDANGNEISEEDYYMIEASLGMDASKYIINMSWLNAKDVYENGNVEKDLLSLLDSYSDTQYVPVSYDLYGSWSVVSASKKGNKTYTAEDGLNGYINIADDDLVELMVLFDDGNCYEVEEMNATYHDGRMYDGCENLSWYYDFYSESMMFQYTMLDDGKLEVLVTDYSDYDNLIYTTFICEKAD